jgi:hypothetical protein
VWNRLWNQLWNRLWNQLFYGQQDDHCLVFYAYCMQVLRIKAPKQFVTFMLLAQEVNWWIPIEKTVYATRKPKECVVKDDKLLKLTYQDNYTIA